MTRAWSRCCALCAAAVLSFASNATLSARADEKPSDAADEVGEQRMSVAGLVPTPAAAKELEELCVALVEPASWEQAGGAGKLKAGRASVTVTNSKTAREGVRNLLAALGKLPALDAKSAAAPPKPPRVDIAPAKEAKPTSPKPASPKNKDEPPPAALVVYSVADLVWDGEKAPPHFDTLVMLIETCVTPEAWPHNGGDGELKTFGPRGALIVRARPDTLSAIDGVLAAVRSLPPLAGAGNKIEPVGTTVLATKLGAKGDCEARLYHVGDLAVAAGGTMNLNAAIQRIMDNASPESWQRNGGDGSLRKLADRGGLLIVNTPSAHGTVEAELAKIRAEVAAAGTVKPPKPAPRRAGK